MHVAAAPPPVADRVEVFLRQQGLSVQCAADPFRALARLTHKGCEGNPVTSVVVGIDYLSPDEFEFFEIIRREQPAIALYVYGDPRCEDKVRRAEQYGAVRLSLARGGSVPTPGPADPNADTPAGIGAGEETIGGAGLSTPAGPASRVSAEDQAMPPCGSDFLGSCEAGELAREKAVRVPWRRYVDTPRRVPPRRAVLAAHSTSAPPPRRPAPPAVMPQPQPPRPSRVLDEEPLLSEEEFEALVGGDDVLDGGEAEDGGDGRRPG